MIDLHLNYPVLPGQADMVAEALRDYIPRLELPPYGGYDDRREWAARWLSERGYAAPKERVLLCSGGHHAVMVTLLGSGLRGTRIAVDPLTYGNFRVQTASLGIELVTCRGDADGMLPESLDRADVRAVYLMPTVHNPLGSVMPERRRRELCEVARRRGIWILEDEAYCFMDATPPPPFAALAPDLTFSVRSFTKEFAPWLKMSYLVFPDGHADALNTTIRVTSSGAAEVFSAVTTRLIESGALPKLVAAKREDAAKRQSMAREVLKGLPLRGHATSYHVWVDLPESVAGAAIAEELRSKDGILVTPGENYRANPAVSANGLRIALGTVRDESVLGEALGRVQEAITRALPR